jgi:hypothetical protein
MPLFGRHRARDDANVTARRRGWALFNPYPRRKNRAYYAPTLTATSPMPIEHTPPPPGSTNPYTTTTTTRKGRSHDAKKPRRIVRTRFSFPSLLDLGYRCSGARFCFVDI